MLDRASNRGCRRRAASTMAPGRDRATARAADRAEGSRVRRRLEVIWTLVTSVLPGLERAWAEEDRYGLREARRKPWVLEGTLGTRPRGEIAAGDPPSSLLRAAE